jgi:hypothetical protein
VFCYYAKHYDQRFVRAELDGILGYC